ncbi:hypothetical protein CKAN_01221400 [Cinnamomum micranthum f. kanehirae]|uniref:Uncharacterized protein n=1 Tax=Cinnamomum micranthum f. kanehirae TaxID=337451 RepID=A0A3S3QEQ4_9MAGN|nr:hypothetical protein CKAN_01221400 [Cinnamomum micranthum f. kanehirae]
MGGGQTGGILSFTDFLSVQTGKSGERKNHQTWVFLAFEENQRGFLSDDVYQTCPYSLTTSTWRKNDSSSTKMERQLLAALTACGESSSSTTFIHSIFQIQIQIQHILTLKCYFFIRETRRGFLHLNSNNAYYIG